LAYQQAHQHTAVFYGAGQPHKRPGGEPEWTLYAAPAPSTTHSQMSVSRPFSIEPPTQTETCATAVSETIATAFQDVLVDADSRTSTISSSATSARGQHYDAFPPPPSFNPAFRYVPCPYCQQPLETRSMRRNWR
jgi:hypothetical protein